MMAFANQYVASIIYKNKIQREFNKDGQRTVQLPFDSEYSIRVQNKNSFKASVDILIDGISIFSSGKTLILNPFQTVDMERFVNDLNSGSKFKYVNLQKAIAEGHQDPSSKDFGVVSIVYTPELVRNTILTYTTPVYHDYNNPIFRSVGNSFTTNSVQTSFTSAVSATINVDTSVGGTVEGSKSNQQFQESNELVFWDYSNTTTIKIKLVGEDSSINKFPDIVYIDNKPVKYQWMNKNPDGSITVHYK